MKILTYLTIGLLFIILTSSNGKIDSLKKVIETAGRNPSFSITDTTKVKVLTVLSNALWKKGEFKEAVQYAKECLKLTEELNFKKAQTNILNIIGVIHYVQSDYPKAMEFYKRAIEIGKELNNKKALANTYNNIGLVYEKQSNYPQALNHYFYSLKIEELAIELKQVGNEQGIALSYNNIGNIYYYQSDLIPALDYYFKSLKIFEGLDNKSGLALTLNNIGLIYEKQSNYSQAMDHYFKSLKIFEGLGNKQHMASAYTNIGSLYTTFYGQSLAPPDDGGDSSEYLNAVWWAPTASANLDSALHYHQKAIHIEKELSDEYTMTHTLSGIADIYFKKGKYDLAIEYYKEATLLADSIRAIGQASNTHKGLSKAFEQLGEYKKSLVHYKQYSSLKDSVFNEEKSKDMGKLEAEHEFELAEQERKRSEIEDLRLENERIDRRNLLQYSGILIFIVVFFIILLFSGQLNIPVRLAEGGVFFTFLLIFEFVLVLTDSYIEQYTGGEPAYKLAINAALAGLIFPLHSIAETKLKQRLFKTKKAMIRRRKSD